MGTKPLVVKFVNPGLSITCVPHLLSGGMPIQASGSIKPLVWYPRNPLRSPPPYMADTPTSHPPTVSFFSSLNSPSWMYLHPWCYSSHPRNPNLPSSPLRPLRLYDVHLLCIPVPLPLLAGSPARLDTSKVSTQWKTLAIISVCKDKYGDIQGARCRTNLTKVR